MTISITIKKTTLSIMTLSIMTLRIMTLRITIKDTALSIVIIMIR